MDIHTALAGNLLGAFSDFLATKDFSKDFLTPPLILSCLQLSEDDIYPGKQSQGSALASHVSLQDRSRTALS